MESDLDELIRNQSGINNEDEEIEERENIHDSLGFWSVVFLTVNATLGAGMLNIPYAFHVSGGIIGSSILHLIHLTLVIGSMIILSHLSHKSSTTSFQALTKYYCGLFLSTFTSLSIFLYSFGSCVTYLLIIRDQFDKIFGTFYPSNYNQYWYFNGDSFLFLIVFVMILPLCCSKDIAFLKYASFFGFICTLYLSVLVFIEYLKITPKDISSDNDYNTQRKWTNIFNVLPVLTFSYQCQLSWVPTYSQTKNPTGKAWIFSMIFFSMLFCFFSYTWSAVFGLLSFGPNDIDKDIMQNYDPNDIFVSFAMILLILKTVVLFPLIMYVGRVVLEDLISFKCLTDSLFSETITRICISFFWILSATLLAIYVPNISVAINYLGSLANLFVFILPGIILYRSVLVAMDSDTDFSSFSYTRLFVSILFVSYGTFVMAISINQTFNEPPKMSLRNLFYKF